MSLLEYDNITGFLFNKNITLSKTKNPNSLLHLGKELVLKVIRIIVKEEKNSKKDSVLIDLSKKDINLDEEEKIKKKFHKSKITEGIIKKLSFKTN